MSIFVPLPVANSASLGEVKVNQSPGGTTSHTGPMQWAWDLDLVSQTLVAYGDGKVIDSFDGFPTKGLVDGDGDGVSDGYDSGIGNFITVEYNSGFSNSFFVTYAHLQQDSVPDQLVDEYRFQVGETLGVSGASGDREVGLVNTAYGYHVHLHFGDRTVDFTHAGGYNQYGDVASGSLIPLTNPDRYVVLLPGSATGSLAFTGTNRDDLFYSSGNGDVFHALGGDDEIQQGAGNDVVDGGDDTDTVVYQSSIADYSGERSIIRVGNTVLLTGPEGQDHLRDVEFIEFSDYNLATSLISDESSALDVGNGPHQAGEVAGSTTFFSSALNGVLQYSLSSLGLNDEDVGQSSFWDVLLDQLSDRIRFPGDGTTQFAIGTSGGEVVVDSSVKYFQLAHFEPVETAQILTVLKAATPPDDGNNSAPSAVQIGSGAITAYTSAAGNIESQGDVDVFRADLQAGQKYSIILWAKSTENSRLDPLLTIRAPNGANWQNDNLGNDTTMSLIVFVAPVSGAYYFEAAGVAGSTGSYLLNITPIDTDSTAENMTPTTGDTDAGNNSEWDWEGDGEDNYPSELTLEQGGAPDINQDNKYRGHGGDDRLRGFGGNDIVWGDSGEDNIDGGDGNDTLRGGSGDDGTINGDNGDDLIYGEGGDDFIDGDISSSNGSGNDTIYGGDGNDDVDAGNGDDYVKGEDDNDDLGGNDGDDEIYGDRGDDIIDGDDGDDQLFGGQDVDSIEGGAGRDRLAGEDGNDILDGEDGDDALYGGDDDDLLRGGIGNDLLHGEDGIDTADFSDGNDGVLINLFDEIAVSSDLGTDTLYSIENVIGADGDDVIDGNHGQNKIEGDDGRDIIRGHNGDDQIDGQWDDDVVWGDEGNDLVRGGNGDDEVRGGLGNDFLYGEGGDDHLRGEQGNDVIDGGTEFDTVFFWGEHDDFSIQLGPLGEVIVADLRVDGLEGTDTLTNVEYIEFFDGKALVSDLLAPAPVAADDALSVKSDRLALLDLIANDITNATGAHYTKVEIATGGGAVAIIGGSIVFDPGEDFAHLDEGEFENVEISYEIQTTGFQSTTGAATIQVMGVPPFINEIRGTAGSDTLEGTTFVDRILGLDDVDYLTGSDGDDQLFGGFGNDLLTGGAGGDVLNGGKGLDRAGYADATAGLVASLRNSDENTGFAAGDTYVSIERIFGTRFDDVLRGNGKANGLWGHNGADRLFGNRENDSLFGMNGGDALYGGSGSDKLYGGAGNDVLNGGRGADTFEFEVGSGADRVVRFGNDVDKIRLDDAIWGGGLSAAQVVSTFGSIVSGSCVLDFGGGNSITFANFANSADLTDDLLII